MPVKGPPHRSIRDFFKPLAAPKRPLSPQNVSDDEAAAAPPKRRSPSANSRERKPPSTGGRRGRLPIESPTSSDAATPSTKKTTHSPGRRVDSAQVHGTTGEYAGPHDPVASNDRHFLKAVHAHSPKLPIRSPTKRSTMPAASKEEIPARRTTRASPSPTSSLSSPPDSLKKPAEQPQQSTTQHAAQNSCMSVSTLSSAPRSSQMAPPKTEEDSNRQAAQSSFGSMSAFSSLPISSQSSSRRVTMGGLPAVTNSDSAGGDTSDSDELADPATLITSKRRKLTPLQLGSVGGINPGIAAVQQSTKNQDPFRQFIKAPPRSPPRPVYRNSLAALVKQREKREQEDSKFAQAEEQFEAAQRRREERAAQTKGKDMNGELVQTLGAEGEMAERMMLAMERTEALQGEEKFLFFSSNAAAWQRSPFPAESLRDSSWTKILANDQLRDQACLTGFTAQMAARGKLDECHLKWVGEEILHESKMGLRDAYVQIVQAFPTTLYKFADSIATFGELYEIRYPNPAFSRRGEEGWPSSLPPGLQSFIPAATHCAANSAYKYGRNLVRELSMALIDDNVREDIVLQHTIEDSIKSLLDSFDDEDYEEQAADIVDDISSDGWKISPQIRHRLILSLPASSERTHDLRRRLALRACSSRPGAEPTTPDSAAWPRILLAHLRTSPAFAIAESTSYALLQSAASVLDIAIDAGFARPTATSPAEDEQRFDRQIDVLAAAVKAIASRIRDAGTSHLKRTEAKSALERVVVRLDYAVRTKPKPKKGVFGDGTEQAVQRNFLNGFLNRAEGVKRDGGGDGDAKVDVVQVKEDELSDREDDNDDEDAGAGADDAKVEEVQLKAEG